MLKNYLKIAWRNLKSKKLYSFINILGLAVGIFCCILIFIYVQDELSYDTFHQKSDQIYRITTEVNFGGNHLQLATATAPMAYTLKREYPEVKAVTRFRETGNFLVQYRDQVFDEKKVIFADSTLFDVFTFEFLRGDPKTALVAPNSVVITRETAQKYFGSQNPIGKTLRFDDTMDMEVTGVIKKLPHNSHFHFSFYASMSTLESSRRTGWLSNNFNTYIVLAKNASPKAFEKKLNTQVLEKYVLPQAYRVLNVTKEELAASGAKIAYNLQPLTDIHLHSHLTAELEANSSIKYVYIFSAIALFILMIACINFMNLSTARSAGRAREVGIRKALGSNRGSLLGQFLFESVLLSVVAFILAIIGAQLAMPFFNTLSGKSLDIVIFTNPELMAVLIGSALAIGLLAGIYPALFLSSFQPAKVLKGTIGKRGGGEGLRSTLVVVQFAISIILIIGTAVIYRQLQYVQQKNLGYQKSQVMILENAYALGDNLPVFKQNMKNYPEITNVTITSYLPVPSSRSDTPFYTGSEMRTDNSVSMQKWAVDYDYIPTMKMKLVKGRNFSRAMGTDSLAIIINQAAADLFGFEQPIGQEISTLDNIRDKSDYTTYHIIGVVKNFNYESLRQNIGALCLFLGNSRGLAAIRFDAAGVDKVIEKAKTEWEKLAPNRPFNYSFMDSRFDAVYRAEQRLGRIAAIFSALAIFVACLGLFAMAAYTAERRVKEIGVRKVMGASVANIVSLLSKDFLKLVLIGFVIAVPVALYFMNQWLQDFAYRIDIGAGIFLLAGGLALFIALATVSWQSIRAALANPVDSLRSE